MPTNTTKFNLVKPLKSEKYNVDVFNGNADIIDSQIYSKSEVDTFVNNKVDKVLGKGLSSNDYTDLEKSKLATIEEGAEVNTVTSVAARTGNVVLTKSDVGLSNVDNTSDLNKPISTAQATSIATKVDKLMATNLVTNGDFSNGTTGWENSGLTSFTVSNGEAICLANVQFGNIRQEIPLISNNRYYFKADIKATNSFIRVVMSGNVTSTPTISHSGSGNYEILSGISIPTTDISWHIFVRDFRTSGFDNFFVKNVLVINLTVLFGSGNEPTREQMDHLLSVYPNSWFNGTREIGSIQALMRATLGVQVVTPTLLNSRTGTAQYVVSKDGLVVFRGTASGGSLNTNIFVLPANIRPAATRVFPISANSAFGVITVAANGEVRQTVGALTNVSLDGIVFKVGV